MEDEIVGQWKVGEPGSNPMALDIYQETWHFHADGTADCPPHGSGTWTRSGDDYLLALADTEPWLLRRSLGGMPETLVGRYLVCVVNGQPHRVACMSGGGPWSEPIHDAVPWPPYPADEPPLSPREEHRRQFEETGKWSGFRGGGMVSSTKHPDDWVHPYLR